MMSPGYDNMSQYLSQVGVEHLDIDCSKHEEFINIRRVPNFMKAILWRGPSQWRGQHLPPPFIHTSLAVRLNVTYLGYEVYS